MTQRYTGGPMTVTQTGTSISTSGTSSSDDIPNDSSGNVAKYIYVSTTAAAHVKLGIGSATATADDLLVTPETPVLLHVPSGLTKVAAIQDSAGGTVTVVPLENA